MGRDGDIAFESRPVRLRKTRDNAPRSHSELEDDMYSKFHYYVEGNSMTLTTERGENQLWKAGKS